MFGWGNVSKIWIFSAKRRCPSGNKKNRPVLRKEVWAVDSYLGACKYESELPNNMNISNEHAV